MRVMRVVAYLFNSYVRNCRIKNKRQFIYTGLDRYCITRNTRHKSRPAGPSEGVVTYGQNARGFYADLLAYRGLWL